MTTHSHRILIVGGVAGGASAATRARRVDERATIVLFEKDADVSFANCGMPYHLGGVIADRGKLLVGKPAMFRDRFRIDVRTRHEVLAIDRGARTVRVRDHVGGRDYDEPYDKLILAPGAAPIRPNLPGVASEGVFTLRNLDDMDRIAAALPTARRAAVVGAGFIGLEVAEQLRERGLAVTLIEKFDQVLPLLDAELGELLRRELQRQGVEVVTGCGFTGIDSVDGRASAVRLEDGRSVPADLVVLGLGVRANIDLALRAGLAVSPGGGIATDEHQRTSDRDIYAVGDAADYALGHGGRGRVPLAGIANRTGRLAGQHAGNGSGAPAPAAWGTAIVKVFGLAAGITGDSLRAAKKRGLDARVVHITANHHAGYYPGATPLTLALVYEAPSGRVLGLQAVGAHGVDKRLDVVATLLHARGSVRDLAQLDLAYAPPFGSAKDPLHMAAFAAGNDLDGLAPLVPPTTDLAPFQVVDVRDEAERARLPLADAPHARAIPLDRLRERAGELDRTRPTVVSCHSGLRAHVATRLLRELGFDARNLSGAAFVRDLAHNRPQVAPVATPGPAANAAPCGPVAACGAPLPDSLDDDATPNDVADAQARRALLLDVRSPAEFRGGRVRGAHNLPLEHVEAGTVRTLLERTGCTSVLLLCASGGRARTAAARLQGHGLAYRVVVGGTTACARLGMPLEHDARGTLSIERQVRIAAGGMVLLAQLLAWFVQPAWSGLAAFVGTGLVVAGITDWCGLGLLLARMPWNR